VSDDGSTNSVELEIRIVDAQANLAVDPLDVELERHTKLSDDAVFTEHAAQNRRSAIADRLSQLQEAAAEYQGREGITDEDWSRLAVELAAGHNR
jgi:ribosomal silencing factor RsfS